MQIFRSRLPDRPFPATESWEWGTVKEWPTRLVCFNFRKRDRDDRDRSEEWDTHNDRTDRSFQPLNHV